MHLKLVHIHIEYIFKAFHFTSPMLRYMLPARVTQPTLILRGTTQEDYGARNGERIQATHEWLRL